jgi:protein subunit release factor A
MKRTIHITPAEGGEDSRLFASDLAGAFEKLAVRMDWKAG